MIFSIVCYHRHHMRYEVTTFPLFLFSYIKTNQMSPADYCSQCSAFLYPGRSLLWVFLGVLPTGISYLFGIVYLFTWKFRHLKVFILMELGYIFDDSILKSILKGPRPDQSCKTNYGMPSSHMTMLTTFVVLRFYNSPYWWEKALWAIVLVLEGISRNRLNYHTYEQIIVGVCVGVVFYYAFEAVWRVCESSVPNFDEDADTNELDLKLEDQAIDK